MCQAWLLMHNQLSQLSLTGSVELNCILGNCKATYYIFLIVYLAIRIKTDVGRFLGGEQTRWISPIQTFCCWTKNDFCTNCCHLFDGSIKQIYKKGEKIIRKSRWFSWVLWFWIRKMNLWRSVSPCMCRRNRSDINRVSDF